MQAHASAVLDSKPRIVRVWRRLCGSWANGGQASGHEHSHHVSAVGCPWSWLQTELVGQSHLARGQPGKTAPDHLAFSIVLNLSDLGAGGVGEGLHGAGGADGAACGARGQSAAHRLLWQWRGPAGRGQPGAQSFLVSRSLVVFTSRTNISQPAFLAYIGRQKSPMAGSRLRQFLSLTTGRDRKPDRT